MSIFPSGSILFSKKQMRYNNAQKSVAMKKLMGNEKIAQAFSDKSDQNTLYKIMKEKAKEGANNLSKREMKAALAESKMTLDDKKVAVIAKEIFHSSKLPSSRKSLKELRSRPNVRSGVGNNVQSRMMPRRTPSTPPINNNSPSLSIRLPH